jgi:hypothetical protein
MKIATIIIALWWGLLLSACVDDNAERASKRLVLPLPLDQAWLNWEFVSCEDLLASDLYIVVNDGSTSNHLWVTKQGRCQNGWQLSAWKPANLSLGEGAASHSFIFTYSSSPLLIASNIVEVIFDAKADLHGASPFVSGFLPKGKYRAEGILVEDHIGLRPDWTTVWPVVITRDSGWLSPKKARTTRRAWDEVRDLPVSRKPPIVETRQYFVTPSFCRSIIIAAEQKGYDGDSFQEAIRMLFELSHNVYKCQYDVAESKLRITMPVEAFNDFPSLYDEEGQPLCVLWDKRQNNIRCSQPN